MQYLTTEWCNTTRKPDYESFRFRVAMVAQAVLLYISIKVSIYIVKIELPNRRVL